MLTVESDAQRADRLRATQVRVVGAAFLRFRAVIVAPSAFLALALLSRAGVPSRQLAAVTVGISTTAGLFVIEALFARTRTVSDRWLSGSLLATLGALGAACAATGGASSPVLPLLFAPTVTTFAAFGRRRESTVALASLVALVAGLALLPSGVPFAPIAEPWRRVLTAHFVAVSSLLLYASVASLTDAFARHAAALDRLRESVLDESRARGRTLDAVGAKVAHEIKNPLQAIKGLVALLARRQTERRDIDRVAVIESEIIRMESILSAWLTFSRPLEDLAPSRADVGAIVRDVAALVEAQAEAAGVTLRVDAEALWFTLDARRMKAAVLNLAANALDATPRGGTVSLVAEGTPTGLRLAVRDTGPGLTSEALARVGTAFYTTREGGTGLGVLLARVAVEQHGGALRIESAPGEGTCAIVELPARGAEVG